MDDGGQMDVEDRGREQQMQQQMQQQQQQMQQQQQQQQQQQNQLLQHQHISSSPSGGLQYASPSALFVGQQSPQQDSSQQQGIFASRSDGVGQQMNSSAGGHLSRYMGNDVCSGGAGVGGDGGERRGMWDESGRGPMGMRRGGGVQMDAGGNDRGREMDTRVSGSMGNRDQIPHSGMSSGGDVMMRQGQGQQMGGHGMGNSNEYLSQQQQISMGNRQGSGLVNSGDRQGSGLMNSGDRQGSGLKQRMVPHEGMLLSSSNNEHMQGGARNMTMNQQGVQDPQQFQQLQQMRHQLHNQQQQHTTQQQQQQHLQMQQQVILWFALFAASVLIISPILPQPSTPQLRIMN